LSEVAVHMVGANDYDALARPRRQQWPALDVTLVCSIRFG